MTPDQTPGDQTPGHQTPGDPARDGERLPPESRAARSLTDRSRPEDIQPPPHPEPEHGPRIWPRVAGVLILLLGVTGAWAWQNPGFFQNQFASLFPASRNATTARIEALEARVAHLEQRPPPADLTPRLDALERRAPDLRPLQARLDALEARPAGGVPSSSAPTLVPVGPDVRPLLARLDALEKTAPDRAAEPARIDALASQVAALSAHDPDAEFRGRLDDLARQLNALAASQGKQNEASDRAVRLARLAAADIALEGGQAMGSSIPDAPPALARFASTAPPTEAALRLSFPDAARAALKVSQPDIEGKPFLDRVVARLRDFKLITVREGDQVLIGNPATGVLAHAQTLLDAGDLAGAAREVATLTGPPAERMAAWLADANALVAAREALAALAGQG